MREDTRYERYVPVPAMVDLSEKSLQVTASCCHGSGGGLKLPCVPEFHDVLMPCGRHALFGSSAVRER